MIVIVNSWHSDKKVNALEHINLTTTKIIMFHENAFYFCVNIESKKTSN